jgi:hypothetical protein
VTGKHKKNKLPLGIRLNCWLCKAGISKMFCIVCPPLLPLAEEEIKMAEGQNNNQEEI